MNTIQLMSFQVFAVVVVQMMGVLSFCTMWYASLVPAI